MNNENTPRRLLLERLESRALLAAGILDFTIDSEPRSHSTDRDALHREVRHDHRAEQRTDSARPIHEVQHSRRPPRPSIDGQTRDQQSRDRRSNVRPQETPLQDTPLQFAPPLQSSSTTLPVERPPVIQTPTFVQPTPLAPVASTAPRVPNGAPASLPQPRNVDAALATVVKPDEDAVADKAEEARTVGGEATVLTSEVSIVTEELASPADIARENLKVTADEPRNDAFTPIERLDTSIAQEHTIELSPLPMLAPAENTSEDKPENAPWVLNRQTLPLLRRIVEGTTEDRAELVDEMIQDWFSDVGGMITLDQVTLPSSILSIPLDDIHVQIESIVGLNRSLGIVASNAAPAISGPVLDAIMASLDQAAHSEAQPIQDAPALHISSAAYPAAVLATTLAVSHRRKQAKKASLNLQATSLAKGNASCL